MEILLACLIGAAFGAALDRVGATNPGFIIGMLNLSNLHLMKTILLAIGVGSILMFGGQMAGLVEVGHMSVKGAYWGVIVGGAILGAGFAIAGYCPGTGLAAAATGRRDGISFILGGLAGAALYMGVFGGLEATWLLDAILGGKTTIGAVPGAEYPALLPGMRGDVVGLVLGVIFILVAVILPSRRSGQARSRARAEA